MALLVKDVRIIEDLGDEYTGKPGFVYNGWTFVFASVSDAQAFLATSSDADLMEVIGKDDDNQAL